MTEKHEDTQVAQMKEAIKKIVSVGPDFLAKKIPAEKMAHTMIRAVEDYATKAKEENNLQPKSYEARELQDTLREILGCGSGFLDQRCDADCVARTITYIVDEFSGKVEAK